MKCTNTDCITIVYIRNSQVSSVTQHICEKGIGYTDELNDVALHTCNK